jgi:hypothetical protein
MDKASSPTRALIWRRVDRWWKNAKLAAGSAQLRLGAGEVHSRLPQLRTEAGNQTVDPRVMLIGWRVELRLWPNHGGSA